jgi:hypothetical protein
MAQVAPPKLPVEPANGGNQPDHKNESIDPGIGSGGGSTPPPATPALKTRFYGSIDLNQQKVASSVQKVVDEVVQHLVAKYGTNIRITLDIEADNAEGFEESVVRTVSENANTLGFSQKGFE